MAKRPAARKPAAKPQAAKTQAAKPQAAKTQAAKTQAAKTPQGKAQPSRTPLMEWVAAGLGLVLILVIAGLLAVQASMSAGPPVLRVVELDRATNAGGHTINVEVANDGGKAASAVLLEGALSGPDGERETAEANLDYVPARSKRKASLVFRSDPTGGAVELRVMGYVEP